MMGMDTVTIGEFRRKLGRYLLDAEEAVAIAHKDAILGYYIPVTRKRAEAEWEALKEAVFHLQETLAAKGVGEEEVIEDFRRWRVRTSLCLIESMTIFTEV
jgi:hypothetical protein